MYPAEKIVMRNPMPQTTESMTADSGSSHAPADTSKNPCPAFASGVEEASAGSPAAIQVYHLLGTATDDRTGAWPAAASSRSARCPAVSATGSPSACPASPSMTAACSPAVSCPPACPSIPNSSVSDSTADAPTPSQIGQCDCPLRNFAPRKPLTHAPIKGRSGISQE